MRPTGQIRPVLLRVACGPAGLSHTVLDEIGSLCLEGTSGWHSTQRDRTAVTFGGEASPVKAAGCADSR